MGNAPTRTFQTLLVISLVWSSGALAQGAPTPKKTGATGQQGDYMLSDPSTDAPADAPLKFNTDSPAKNTDHRAPLKFKDAPEAQSVKDDGKIPEGLPEEAPFQTYIGYPKHALGAQLGYVNVAADWTYNGQEFNFRSNSPEYLINYIFTPTPQMSVELDYTHYTLSVDSAVVGTGAGTRAIVSSSQGFDEYYAKFRYCFISSSSFARRLCPGVDIGNDAYPVLGFQDSTHLAMSKVQDYTVGVNITYQMPFTDIFLIKGIAGYNMGLGIGNSGVMKSTSNSSYYVTVQTDWLFGAMRNHDVIFGFDFKARKASINGLVGASNDTWDTDATTFAGRVGYAYTFQ